VDPKKTIDYLDIIEDFTKSKPGKKFAKAFRDIARKIDSLHKRYPNSLEYQFLDTSLGDIRDFMAYASDKVFETMSYVNDLEMKLSDIVGENERYAKILACLGVTPMVYFTLSDECLDFIIDNYSQIGILTLEQLVDIDLAYTICLATFKDPPKDYNQLKKVFNFIQKRATDEKDKKDSRRTTKNVSGRVERKTPEPQKRRRRRN
jgi:hypothetical protein